MKLLPESCKVVVGVTLETQHLAQETCAPGFRRSCCFDRVQQPLSHVALERVLAPNAFILSFKDRFGLHKRGFHLQKTEDAFCVRCLTDPPLCAPGSITEPMNSSFRSHSNTLATHRQSFSVHCDGTAPVSFVQTHFQPCLTKLCAAVFNHGFE